MIEPSIIFISRRTRTAARKNGWRFLGEVEAERQCVRGHRFKADGARNCALNHGRHIFLREDREVEVDIMVDCVKMCLPIIMMLTRVKVARPDVHVLKDSSRANLVK